MNSKNNRVNHDFQIAYFLAGSCHTADGAYSLLCDLREDRKAALGFAKAESLRAQAKLLRARRALDDQDEAVRMDAQADFAEAEAAAEIKAACHAAAVAELATIENLIEQLQPHRRFAHLSDPLAHEAAQRDEWRAELLHRAQNALFATGAVGPELLSTMRMHPDFAGVLLPTVIEWSAKLTTEAGRDELVAALCHRPASLTLNIPTGPF